MEEIEVSKRDFFQYDVKITEIGSRLSWKFSTKRKNIGFGLYFKPDSKIELKLLPEQFESIFDSLGPSELLISPPPKRSSKIKRAEKVKHKVSHSVYQYNNADGPIASLRPFDPPSYNDASPSKSFTEPRKGHGRKLSLGGIPKKGTSMSLGRYNYGPNLHRQALQVGAKKPSEHDINLIDATEADIFVEIIPVQKYDSYKYEVTGYIVAPLPGVYTLLFDNSFSMNTSKHLYYKFSVIDSQKVFEGKEFARDANNQKRFSGWILKRRRNRLKGYSKKWAQIGDGKLLFSDGPENDLIEILDICECSIAKIPSARRIILDSGRNVYHFRALTFDDYYKWLDAIVSYKRLSEPKPEHNMDIGQKACEILGYLEVSRLNLSECITLLTRASQSSTFSDDESVILSRLLDRIAENINFVKKEGSVLLGPMRKYSSVDSATSVVLSAQYSSDDEKYYDANDVMILNESSDDDSLEYLSVEEAAYQSDDGEDIEDESNAVLNTSIETTLPLNGYFGSLQNVIVPIPGDVLSFLSSLEKIPWQYRTSLPHGMCPITVSIASLFRKSIGKDSSTLSMPICLNEPVNILQRICQEFEYAELLNIACHLEDSLHRLIFIAAFACSSYSYTLYRAERKPFNPLLGETFEYISDSKAFRFLGEKVSHNPPIMACHVEGCLKNDYPMYEFWQDFRVKSKFWGKSIEFIPYGNCYLKFNNTGEVFTWKKVTSSIHNVIGGTPWAEHYGELKIKNTLKNETCTLNFRQERGLFSQSSDNEVNGIVRNAEGKEMYLIKGSWNERLFAIRLNTDSSHRDFSTSLTSLRDLSLNQDANFSKLEKYSQLIWQHKNMPENYKANYGFNEFTMSLNEFLPSLEPFIPPTDTRRRPDQRLYELGDVSLAEREKMRIEDLQRERRKAMDTDLNAWKPLWFEKVVNPLTLDDSWQYNGKYWDVRRSQSFESISFKLW